jgi:hypothetical protein
VILGKMFARAYLNGKKAGMVMYACYLSDSGNFKIGELQFKSVWAKNGDPISKISRAKRTGDMAQELECLP